MSPDDNRTLASGYLQQRQRQAWVTELLSPYKDLYRSQLN